MAWTACTVARADGLQDDALARAEARGRELYAYDQAAWITTDDLQSRVGDLRRAHVAGWLVEPDGDDLKVTFLAREGDARRAFYVALVREGRIVSAHVLGAQEDTALGTRQIAMLRARDAAAAAAPAPCTRAPSNSIVLPDAEHEGAFDVYLMSAWVEANAFPLGGHHLYHVNGEGIVDGARDFSRSCLTIDGAGRDTEALMVTHLMDQTPTEVHVFLSLTFAKPIFVSIAGTQNVYAVEGDHIRSVSARLAEASAP